MHPISKALGAGGLVLALALAVCAPPSPAQTPRSGGVLRFAVRAEPSTLDPHRGSSGSDHMSLYPIFDTLVRFDANMNPQPGLAESWEMPDPKTLILHLRKGVRFHDGTAFDAEAVKFNILRAQDKKMPVNTELAHVDAVDVVDTHRVRLKLKRADASLLMVFSDRAGMMVSPAAAEKLGEGFGRNPVGAGEHRFVKWTPGDSIRTEKFADYWDRARQYLDGVLVKIMPDGDTRLSALKSGQVDHIMEIPQQDFESLRGDRSVRPHERISLAYWRMYLNLSKPPFDKRPAREALQLALDRPALFKTIAFGLGEIYANPFPSMHWAHAPNVKAPATDLGRARAKLAEAGLPNGFTFDMVLESAPEHVRRGEAIQAQLARVGIRVDLKPMELVKGVGLMFRSKEVMAANYRWTGRPDPDQTVRAMFHSKGFFNPGGFQNPRLEDLMEQAVSTYKIDDRKRIYAQIAQIVSEEAIDPGLFFAAALEASSAAVQGYQPNLLGKPIFRGVWLSK